MCSASERDGTFATSFTMKRTQGPQGPWEVPVSPCIECVTFTLVLSEAALPCALELGSGGFAQICLLYKWDGLSFLINHSSHHNYTSVQSIRCRTGLKILAGIFWDDQKPPAVTVLTFWLGPGVKHLWCLLCGVRTSLPAKMCTSLGNVISLLDDEHFSPCHEHFTLHKIPFIWLCLVTRWATQHNFLW